MGMKSAFLLASALALVSCADFWGFDSPPMDTEEDGEGPEAGDTTADTPAEAMDGEEENGGQCMSDWECSDGEFCNGQEICSISGRCEEGEHPFEGTACNTTDGAVGRCSGGICVPAGCGNGFLDGNEECDDGNVARGDGCDPDCSYSCHAAADCLPGPGSDPCVQAACSDVPSGKMCEYTNIDGIECEDGDACMGGDLCLGGACVGQLTIDCFDGVDCTADTCQPATGCVYVPMDELCTDDNPCTADSCDISSGTDIGCIHEALTGDPCDDGYFCTLEDFCGNGGCLGQGSPCSDGLDCTEDICTEADHACTNSLMPGYCLIDGVCLQHLQQSPGNECLVCDAYADTTHWSNATNGAGCTVCVSPCPCGGGMSPCLCCNGVCGGEQNCPQT